MMVKSIERCVSLAAAVLGIYAGLAMEPAAAQSLRVGVATANWTFAGAAQVPVLGMTTRSFPNPANGRFIVTYSAECAVNAPAGNTSGWVDVDIVVLDSTGTTLVATLAPTAGTGDAFCSANGTAGFDGWATHTVVAMGGDGLPAGYYRVQVRARLNGGATGGWFGERFLNVSR